MKRQLILVLLTCFPLHLLLSQKAAPMTVARIDGIRFDGLVNEPAWDAIDPAPMVQYEPNAGASPTEDTEIRMAYDDTYFYVSIRAYDTDPKGIRATSLYRDRIAGSDHLEVVLDTYNDNQSAYIFTTTPAGIRNDLEVGNDAQGLALSTGSIFNRDFNTFWDAESTITTEGWFAEIRIPFSSLRFQEVDGQVIMGVTLQRKIARKNERLVFPAIPPITNWAFLRPSLAQKIVFTGISARRAVYVSPYTLLGYERANSLNDTDTEYQKNTDFDFNAGGEVKYSISNNLTADFTVNTDFAQAEADDQLVNLSRFSLFFPEKRQFFQERASVFDFRTGGLSRLFFSRRIGLTENGERVPIYGGARLIGRMNTWDLGVLNMQTKSLDSIPTENFGALRVRKRVFNKNSFLGAMFTSRIDGEGNSNLAYGLDGVVQLAGDDFLTVQWSQTFDSDIGEDESADFKNGRLAVELNRRRRQGFGYTLGTIFSGPNYRPELGFLDRSDFKFGTAAISQTWLNQAGPFIWHKIEPFGNAFFSNENEELLSSEYGLEWSFSRRNQDRGGLALKVLRENLQDEFPLPDALSVPIGNYDFFRAEATYTIAIDRVLRTGAVLETGTFYDGWLHSLTLTPSWYVSKHLQFDLEYVYNYGEFNDRDDILTFHLARLRIGTALNRKLSTNALVQYNGAQDLFSLNVRFRYNWREGQDLWIVFNSGFNTDRQNLFPRPPTINNQAVLLKYIHTFIF